MCLFIIHRTIDDASKLMTISFVKFIIGSQFTGYICNVQVHVYLMLRPTSQTLGLSTNAANFILHLTAVYLGVFSPLTVF